ncbi:MAG: Hpt domain-containing protein [Verrucomicrobiae bacterium]|nr:Hpt domain-containing protein [Verrucomicrobiae bacterium]
MIFEEIFETAEKGAGDTGALDAELCQIFLEECEAVIPQMINATEGVRETSAVAASIKTLHRHFHTLKGSAGFAGLTQFSQFCFQNEQVCNLFLQGEGGTKEKDLLPVLNQSVRIVLDLYRLQTAGGAGRREVQDLIRKTRESLVGIQRTPTRIPLPEARV